MTIILNGEARKIEAATLAELLSELELGDAVEIVAPMQGG